MAYFIISIFSFPYKQI